MNAAQTNTEVATSMTSCLNADFVDFIATPRRCARENHIRDLRRRGAAYCGLGVPICVPVAAPRICGLLQNDSCCGDSLAGFVDQPAALYDHGSHVPAHGGHMTDNANPAGKNCGAVARLLVLHRAPVIGFFLIVEMANTGDMRCVSVLLRPVDCFILRFERG